MSALIMDGEPLYQDPDLAHFYDLANGWNKDFDFCVSLAKEAKSVLDLGCGTGELAAYLGHTHDVVGVDPADAMLAHARARDGGDKVLWVVGDGRTVRLDRTFDLIVLTGHAYQVFLEDADQLALLQTIALHLAPGGRFVFDSRNPSLKAWEGWDEKDFRLLNDPRHGETEVHSGVRYDAETEVVTYETTYLVRQSGERFHSSARIRFAPQQTIAQLIERAGLKVDHWYGNWDGDDFTNESAEIIPVGSLA